MYGLYSPYGGCLSYIYWRAFRLCKAVRWLSVVGEKRLPFPYKEICTANGTKSKMSFNMGSPGAEQKISILGFDLQSRQRFFAKYSQKERARRLTLHEAEIYRMLGSEGLTPRLLTLKENEGGVYMKAEYIQGRRPESRDIDGDILGVAMKLGKYHIEPTPAAQHGLQTSLSHGDFCPWNILVHQGTYRLIDWELAAERPLGYDLLTYICNVSALFEPKMPLIKKIEENKSWLDKYFSSFQIQDYSSYLKTFAHDKAAYERGKQNLTLALPYELLVQDL